MKHTENIKIGWLYPRLMSTYGDRGNIYVLQKRLAWRGYDTEVVEIHETDRLTRLETMDIVMMGGAQDVQQEIVAECLMRDKDVLLAQLESGLPGLFVCGAYQFLGNYYITADNVRLVGLGYFPMYTKSTLNQPRLIGNIALRSSIVLPGASQTIIGFENHGGRSYFDKESAAAFGQVMRGFGNNGEDSTEGLVMHNTIGTYLHGPLLPKNPGVADWLITRVLVRRGLIGESDQLAPITLFEEPTRDYVLKHRLDM